jgi:hypothetical protein
MENTEISKLANTIVFAEVIISELETGEYSWNYIMGCRKSSSA